MKRCAILFCINIISFFSLLQADSLPLWNEGPSKQAIIQFVEDVTQVGSPHFIPPEYRIATFDQDGTLLIEQPICPEDMFTLGRLKVLAPQHPEWKLEEPFKSILSSDANSFDNITFDQVISIYQATTAGISIDDYQQNVADWLKSALHPKFKKPFRELVYKPMLEVMKFLRDHQFDIYIVSGGGQEFIRVFSKSAYQIPPDKIIGTAMQLNYEYDNGKSRLMITSDTLFVNLGIKKPEAINLFIGKRPIIAFGNSTGDQQMLEWSQGAKGKSLQLLVNHDDDIREYAYGSESKIGTFSKALMDESKRQKWIVISMKNDWREVF